MSNGALTAFIVLITTLIPSLVFGQVADDQKMAAEALAPFVRKNADESIRQLQLQQFQKRVDNISARDPSKVISGTLVMATGFTVDELVALAEQHNIEIVSIHVKTPYNERGVIQSIDIGSDSLAKHRGSFRERAERAIGVIRYEFLEWSKNLPDGDAVAHYNVAHSRMLIYRCDIYGEARSLSELSQAENITLFVPDRSDLSDAKIAAHKGLMETYERAWQEYERRQAGTKR